MDGGGGGKRKILGAKASKYNIVLWMEWMTKYNTLSYHLLLSKMPNKAMGFDLMPLFSLK